MAEEQASVTAQAIYLPSENHKWLVVCICWQLILIMSNHTKLTSFFWNPKFLTIKLPKDIVYELPLKISGNFSFLLNISNLKHSVSIFGRRLVDSIPLNPIWSKRVLSLSCKWGDCLRFFRKCPKVFCLKFAVRNFYVGKIWRLITETQNGYWSI